MRSQRTLAHLLKPRTVDSEVATQDESMVARAHRYTHAHTRAPSPPSVLTPTPACSDQALSELEKVTEANAALNEQLKTLTEALESLRQEHGTAAEQLRNTKAELSSARVSVRVGQRMGMNAGAVWAATNHTHTTNRMTCFTHATWRSVWRTKRQRGQPPGNA